MHNILMKSPSIVEEYCATHKLALRCYNDLMTHHKVGLLTPNLHNQEVRDLVSKVFWK